MADKGFGYRCFLAFFLVNAVVFGVLCVAAKQTGLFHLRVLCEGFAAGYFVLLAVWICLARSNFLPRLLAALIGAMMVTAGCRYVLDFGFAVWTEWAMWYVPVTIILCIPLRLTGHVVEQRQEQNQAKTFSIFALMMITAAVALLFPFVRWLVKTRAGGELDWMLWLTDPLVLVAPISAIGVGLVWAVLSNKPFHAGVMIIAAPVSGLLTSRIYGWDHSQSVVIPAATAAIVIALTSRFVSRQGFRFVKQVPVQPDTKA